MSKTCPKCGLVVAFTEEQGEPRFDGPTCNPIRSPDCWRVVGKTTKPDAFGRKRMLKLVQRIEEPNDDEGLDPIETSPLTEREPDL